LIINNLKKYQV